MQSKRIVVALVALVVGVAGWYAFRPERLWIDQKVSESLPAAANAAAATEASPAPLLAGAFHTNAHATKGEAAVLQLASGERVLRLTGFETSNGPDVHVYLVAANDVTDDATVAKAGYVDLGSLKGNVGDQNYAIPDGVDLGTHRTVTIWCARFRVNFGSAPLSSAMADAMPSSAAPMAVAEGAFHTNAHETKGTAAIYTLASGERVLRLSQFETSNGPDVHVYLVAAGDVSDDATVKRAGYVDLGSLKGNVGDQNYALPADVDLAAYRTVTIWCARFGVNFGSAPLSSRHS